MGCRRCQGFALRDLVQEIEGASSKVHSAAYILNAWPQILCEIAYRPKDFQPTGLMKLVNSLALKGMVADRHVGEALVKGSDLDWTLIYASRLKDGPRAGYKLLPGKVPMNASITRADVAAALVAAVDDPSAARQVRNVAGN